MTRNNLFAVVLLACAMLLTPRATKAAESYDNCTGFITSVPTIISTQGTWCLKQDLATAMTTGQAITINANNVTVDCNNFKLGGLAAGAGTVASGIYALDRFNVTVRRCNIRGFYAGVKLSSNSAGSGGGHVVEDNRFDGNTFYGLVVFGDGSVVRRNRIFDTGGSTQGGAAYGIYLAYSVDVFDNIIAGVTADSSTNAWATGISTFTGLSSRIIGNSVRGVVADGIGNPVAIANQSDDHLVIRNNDLAGDATAGSQGITCGNASDSARDNVISGFASALISCTDSGGNDVVP